LEQVPDSEVATERYQYAILSHRWGAKEEEVTYEDMISASPITKEGLEKIKRFRQVALSAGCQYGWVETCCVNKNSATEEAEALNSMYRWYGCSKICIAYLDDVDVSEKTLEDSEWFDRGWTLQALIAPKRVAFFNRRWNPIGTKNNLLAKLSLKTRIPKEVLSDASKVFTCSVAQRMSWASRRITERAEDRAYSLMGLFGVNMPPLYGERENAFLRLQQQIAHKTKDESLFAWSMGPFEDNPITYSGLYAPSPSNFLDCGDIVSITGSKGFLERNGELSINLPRFIHSPGLYQALLHCAPKSSLGKRVYIVVAGTDKDGEFVRLRDTINKSVGVSQVSPRPEDWKHMSFPLEPNTPPKTILFGFWLRTLRPPGYDESEITILSNCASSETDYIHQADRDHTNTGIVRFKSKNRSESPDSLKIRWIKFGFDDCFNPILWLANDSQSERLGDSFEQAMASRRHSSPPSLGDKEAIKGDIETKIACGEGSPYFESNDIVFGWPSGKAVVKVDRHKGLRELVVFGLNVQISVVLQPYQSPVNSVSNSEKADGSQLRPDKIWVVDIITAYEGISGSPTPELLFEIPEFQWRHWFWLVLWYPCALCCCLEKGEPCNPCWLFCCGFWVPKDNNGPSGIDLCYPFCRKYVARKIIKERMEHRRELQAACERAADFEIPLLVPRSVIKPRTEGYGQSANCLASRIVPRGTQDQIGRNAIQVPDPMFNMWAHCFE
jgi:hypothetical protein